MYSIADWIERYEVNSKGQPARQGDELRVKPLEYIRQKVHGRSQGPGYRKLLEVAGKRKAAGVFGIFKKCLEIAGDAKREDRGVLPDADEIAFLTSFPLSQVQYAIEVMLKIGWISQEIPENAGNPKNIPAPYITERNETEHNITEHNETETEEKPFAENSPSFSSGSLRAKEQKFELLAIKLFNAITRSDRTTIKNITAFLASKVRPDIFTTAWELAQRAKKEGKKPIAMFISLMKSELGYKANV